MERADRPAIDIEALQYQVLVGARNELIKWVKSWVIWVVITIMLALFTAGGGGMYLLKLSADAAIEAKAKGPVQQVQNQLSEMKGQIGTYSEIVKDQKKQADELENQQGRLRSDTVQLATNVQHIKHFLTLAAATEVQNLMERLIVEHPDASRDPIRQRLAQLRDMLKTIEISEFTARPFIEATDLIDRRDGASLQRAVLALRQAPEGVTKHRLLGYVHTRLGNKEQAAQAMKAAVNASREYASRRREEDIKVRLNYAQYVLALQEQRYEEAEKEFRAAMKELEAQPLHGPLMGAVYFGSGGIYSISGKIRDALNELMRANSHNFPVIEEVEKDKDGFFKNLKAELGKGGKSWKQELRRELGGF